jgi:hypothetical protein
LVVLAHPEHGEMDPPPVHAPVVVVKHPQHPTPKWPHHGLERPMQLEDFTEILVAIEPSLAVSHQQPAFDSHPTMNYRDASLSFKLAAWPSSAVLMHHPHFSRLAAFLRSRFLSFEDLARLSRCEESTIMTFLGTLHDLQLLQSHRRATEAESPSANLAAASPAGRVLGIIERLRRKMGLSAV